MLKDTQGVIFDLDGTLVDSMWIWRRIDIDYLGKRKIALPSDLQKNVEGMSFTETAHYFKKRFSLKEPIEEIKKEWLEMAEDYYREKVPLKKGVLPLLRYLKDRHIKMGIGTSNARDLVETVILKHGIESFFGSVRTACEVNRGKPYPDIFLKVAEDLKIAPKNCLVFEDTYAGVLAAKRAGMRVFAVQDDSSIQYKANICSIADGYIEGFEQIA